MNKIMVKAIMTAELAVKIPKKNTPESIKTTRVQTEIDELRRREQERRVKEAMENQIDINRQSDLLTAFEEEYF